MYKARALIPLLEGKHGSSSDVEGVMDGWEGEEEEEEEAGEEDGEERTEEGTGCREKMR